MNLYGGVREKLVGVGLKATQQRLVILHAICNSKKHPTAEDIYDAVKTNNPSLSLATIYSALETFTSKGLINKVPVKDGAMRYDAHTAAHHHIYCTNTKEIIDFEDDELNELIKEFLKKRKIENLVIKDVSLHLQGEKIDKRKNIKID